MNSGADLAPELRPRRTLSLSSDQESYLGFWFSPEDLERRQTKRMSSCLGDNLLKMNCYFEFVQRGCGPIFATKNVCKNLIANVQLEAMGQEQVVQKQKTVGC